MAQVINMFNSEYYLAGRNGSSSRGIPFWNAGCKGSHLAY
jgi:hypothetical protein